MKTGGQSFPRSPVLVGRATEVASVRIWKLLLVVAVLAVVAALAACSGSDESPPDEAVAPDAPSSEQKQTAEDRANAPSDETLTLTVPKMERVKNSPIPNTFGDDEDALRDFAGIPSTARASRGRKRPTCTSPGIVSGTRILRASSPFGT